MFRPASGNIAETGVGNARRITWRDIAFFLFQTGLASPLNKKYIVPLGAGEEKKFDIRVKAGQVLVITHYRSWCDPDASIHVRVQVDDRFSHEYLETSRDYWVDMFEAGLPVEANNKIEYIVKNVTESEACFYLHVLGAYVRYDAWKAVKLKVLGEVGGWLASTTY